MNPTTPAVIREKPLIALVHTGMYGQLMRREKPKVNTPVYGKTAGERLAREDWIRAGLKALARSGATELKADVLAGALGVSRGSFYWHFEDVGAFHRAVLDAWEQRATSDVIALVEATSAAPHERLRELIRIVFSSKGRLERQIRSWAARDTTAAAAQERVDQRRLGYVVALLKAAGCPRVVTEPRAHFLYLALIGQFSAGEQLALKPAEITVMIDLLLAPVEPG